ncbi:MAG: hypothetical protein V1859_04675 [archaeon]
MKPFLKKISTEKKADLNLSINAIVVLILAITMLALGLGFIRNMFGKGMESTLKNLDKLETDRMDNLMANCNDEVCLDKIQLQIKRGEKQNIIAVVNNRYPCDINSVALSLGSAAPFTCSAIPVSPPSPPAVCSNDVIITSLSSVRVAAGSKAWAKFNIQAKANSALTQFRYYLIFNGDCSPATSGGILKQIPIEIEVTG